jgi:hypothetical protein
MITIFHGEDSSKSRNSFFSHKQQNTPSISLEGNTLSITSLTQSLSGEDLFAQSQNVYIEELLSKRKPSKELEAIVNYISKQASSSQLFIWESKKLSPTQLKAFSKANIQQFDYPKVLFAFLDSIIPKNGKQSLQLFHDLLKTQEVELIFFMMVRHIRMMLGTFLDENTPLKTDVLTIDELSRLAPWQKSKLIKQASIFGLENLKQKYEELFLTETQQKTGQNHLSLSMSIDFFLSEM